MVPDSVKKWLGAGSAAGLGLWALVGWWQEGLWLDFWLFVAYTGLGLFLVMLPYPESVGSSSEGPRSDGRTPDGRSEKE
jgi:hypothetical protein